MSGSEPCAESPYHILTNGLKVPTFVKQEVIDMLKDFKLYPDDAWVVTFPKCGTTWTQQIVRLIRNGGNIDDTTVDFAVPWAEGLGRPHFANFDVDKLQRPRAFQSHFPYAFFPCGPPHTTPCKYIYVARNPKDVAVSQYFHTRLRYYPDIEWNSFWEKYTTGDLGFGNYFDHLLGWWVHRDDRNVVFLKYEDMKKDLKQAVSQIAALIGPKLPDDIIGKIADMTSFAEMKKDNTANYAWQEMFRDEKTPPFLRKGVVGDWKNFLSPEQSAEMDAICAERLEGTGLVFDYE